MGLISIYYQNKNYYTIGNYGRYDF